MRRPEQLLEQAHWESEEAPAGRLEGGCRLGAGGASLKPLQQAEQHRCPWPRLSGAALRESLTPAARSVEVAVEHAKLARR